MQRPGKRIYNGIGDTARAAHDLEWGPWNACCDAWEAYLSSPEVREGIADLVYNAFAMVAHGGDNNHLFFRFNGREFPISCNDIAAAVQRALVGEEIKRRE